MMKKTLINYLGILGVISLLSYTAAVMFSPMAYPDYNWMSQAVSDLSAANAPSRMLWSQLSAFYGTCGVVSVTAVCVYIAGKLNKPLRTGIYIFAVMNWISDIGYRMFPLSDSGIGGEFQDTMHMVITAAVVLLSIVSLIAIIVGGAKDKKYRMLGIFAAAALAMMFIGGIGTGAAPREIFGIFERMSVFAATGFNAVLGVYLFKGFNEISE